MENHDSKSADYEPANSRGTNGGHPLALTVKRANALCPNLSVGSFPDSRTWTSGPIRSRHFTQSILDPFTRRDPFSHPSGSSFRNSGSLLRSCHRESLAAGPMPKLGIQKTFSAGLCPFTFCVCSSGAFAGLRPTSGWLTARSNHLKLRSAVKMCGDQQQSTFEPKRADAC